MKINFNKLSDKTCLILFFLPIHMIVLFCILKLWFIAQLFTVFFLSSIFFFTLFDDYSERDISDYIKYFLLDILFIFAMSIVYYYNYLNIDKNTLIRVCEYGRYGRFYGCSLVNEYQHTQGISTYMCALSYGLFGFMRDMFFIE